MVSTVKLSKITGSSFNSWFLWFYTVSFIKQIRHFEKIETFPLCTPSISTRIDNDQWILTCEKQSFWILKGMKVWVLLHCNIWSSLVANGRNDMQQCRVFQGGSLIESLKFKKFNQCKPTNFRPTFILKWLSGLSVWSVLQRLFWLAHRLLWWHHTYQYSFWKVNGEKNFFSTLLSQDKFWLDTTQWGNSFINDNVILFFKVTTS